MTEANVHQIAKRFRERLRKLLEDDSRPRLAMADVDKLFNDYVAEHRAGGEADPRAYLERVEGVDRDELATLIDAYLVRSPGRSWDPEAYEGSPAQALVAGIERSIGRQGGHLADAVAAPARSGEDQPRRSWSSDWRRPSVSAGRPRRSPATTTRWSRARSTPAESRPGCWRRSAAIVGSSAERAAQRRREVRGGATAVGGNRLRAGRDPASGVRGKGASTRPELRSGQGRAPAGPQPRRPRSIASSPAATAQGAVDGLTGSS